MQTGWTTDWPVRLLSFSPAAFEKRTPVAAATGASLQALDQAVLLRGGLADRPGESSFRVGDDSLGTFEHGIPLPSGRQASELEAVSYGIMSDGR